MKRNKNYLKCLTILAFVAAISIAGAASADAQNRNRRVRRVQTHVIKKMPKGHVAIRVNGNRFFYHKGIFYGRRTAGFAVVSAPLGAVVKKLPPRKQVVRINRTKYFLVDGVSYIKVKKGYRVVRSPARIRASWGAGYGMPMAAYGIPGLYFSTNLYYAYSPKHKQYAFTFAPSYRAGKTWTGTYEATNRRLNRNDDRFSTPRERTGRSATRSARNRSKRRVD